ncbi:hypothetical protein SVIOM342S_02834 [Streptomyces violaceorubidus]
MITANGRGKARVSDEVPPPAESRPSSALSTRSRTTGSMPLIARGVNAWETSLRSLVWCGGSWSISASPLRRGDRPASSAPRALRLSTEWSARSNASTSLYRETTQKPPGCACTGACRRISA